MARPKKAISAKVLAGVRKEILAHTRLDLPEDLVREVVEREPELRREILASGAELDTESPRALSGNARAECSSALPGPLIGDPRE
jgi:hypothetical protein